MKVQGIKSVDLKITASGSGVVNWNGSFHIYNPQANKSVDNHQVPKLRGLDPFNIKSISDPAWLEAKLIVSQNCIRHALFSHETLGLNQVTLSNVDTVLCSLVGLVRGYVIADDVTKSSLKRKSCLLIEDFVNNLNVGNYEQFGNSGDRNANSMFSKFNFGETKYTSYASINIEDLQFIPVEDTFNRSAYRQAISKEEGIALAEKITEFLKSLDFDNKLNALATFHENYVRVGNIMKLGEGGILLNDDAISLVVENVIERIKNLFLQQSKGWLKVDQVTIDYNNNQPMKIKTSLENIKEVRDMPYAIYYEAKEQSEEDKKAKEDKALKSKEDKKKRKDLEKEKKEKQLKKIEAAKEENKTESGEVIENNDLF